MIIRIEVLSEKLLRAENVWAGKLRTNGLETPYLSQESMTELRRSGVTVPSPLVSPPPRAYMGGNTVPL